MLATLTTGILPGMMGIGRISIIPAIRARVLNTKVVGRFVALLCIAAGMAILAHALPIG